jgi:hypothetical protein
MLVMHAGAFVVQSGYSVRFIFFLPGIDDLYKGWEKPGCIFY